jgi:hypothetical protein
MQHLRRRRQIKPLLLLPQNQWAVPWRQIKPLPQMPLLPQTLPLLDMPLLMPQACQVLAVKAHSVLLERQIVLVT